MSFVFIHAYTWYTQTHAEQDLLRFYAPDTVKSFIFVGSNFRGLMEIGTFVGT